MSQLNHQEQQVLALAAIFQAAANIDKLAATGVFDLEQSSPLIATLFEFDPESTESIFNGRSNISPGLFLLHRTLNGKSTADKDTQRIINLVMACVQVAKLLLKDQDRLELIHSRLVHIERNSELTNTHLSDRVRQISGLYQDSISSLKFRIQVVGQPQYLKDELSSSQVRSLLFTGIRCAILWRQLGGRRWHFLVKRKTLANTASSLLKQ